MNFFREVVLSAALAALIGCSGTYRVGNEAALAGSSNASAGNGNAGNANPGNASAGKANSGGAPSVVANGGSAAVDLRAGAFASDDASGSASFCGNTLPATRGTEFAPPAVVYRRVLKFLYDTDPVIPDDLPTETTREWAGSLASAALAAVSTPSAAGMNRFLRNWWPSLATPEAWAAYFSSKRGTLVDLLTTESQRPNGAGLLTDPSVLSRGSISGRGTAIHVNLLCEAIPSAPPGSTSSPPLMPGQTRRAQLEEAVAAAACVACHRIIDPVAFPLQNFALDGSYRTTENDLPLDTAVVLTFANSGDFLVNDPKTLGSALANNCEVAVCVTRRLVHDATLSAELPHEAGTPEIAAIAAQFTERGLNLPELVRLVVESDAFLSAN